MQNKKEVLTTGDVARLCNVAPRTVTKWFDSGQLRGYRIPGSRDRRIPVAELIRFMKAHQIPTDTIEKGPIRVLIISADLPTAAGLARQLKDGGDFETRTVDNSFEAGLLAEKFRPHAILIDLMDSRIDAQGLCRHIRGSEELQDIRLIAVAAGLSEKEASLLKSRGFDEVITRHDDAPAVAELIGNDCCLCS